jgi:hypothetical protein
MRFIKGYKLFEASKEDIDINLKDIFIELEDRNLNVSIKDAISIIGADKKVIIIETETEDMDARYNQAFTLEDVYYSIIHAKSYMEGEGYQMVRIIGGTPMINRNLRRREVSYINLSYFLSEYERGKGDTLDKNLIHIQLEFIKKS